MACDRQGREGGKTSSLDEDIDRFRSAKTYVRDNARLKVCSA